MNLQALLLLRAPGSPQYRSSHCKVLLRIGTRIALAFRAGSWKVFSFNNNTGICLVSCLAYLNLSQNCQCVYVDASSGKEITRSTFSIVSEVLVGPFLLLDYPNLSYISDLFSCIRNIVTDVSVHAQFFVQKLDTSCVQQEGMGRSVLRMHV